MCCDGGVRTLNFNNKFKQKKNEKKICDDLNVQYFPFDIWIPILINSLNTMYLMWQWNIIQINENECEIKKK